MANAGWMVFFLVKALPIGLAMHFLYRTIFDAKKMLAINPMIDIGSRDSDVDRRYPFITFKRTGVGVAGFVRLLIVSVGFGMLIFAVLSFIMSSMPDSDFKTIGPILGAYLGGVLSTEVLGRLAIRIAKGDYGRSFFEEATNALNIRWHDADGKTGPPKIWTWPSWLERKANPYLAEVELEDEHKDWITQVWLEVKNAEKARPRVE